MSLPYISITEYNATGFTSTEYVLRHVAEDRIKEFESALCETCGDPACEDSRLAYYVAKAIKAGERIGRLEMALADIAVGDCTCFEDDSCAACIAKKELRGGE